MRKKPKGESKPLSADSATNYGEKNEKRRKTNNGL